MSKDDLAIVCALGDAPLTIPGSTFKHRCSKCGRVVMMAPGGQRMLERYPKAVIICGPCFEPVAGDFFAVPSKEAIEDALRVIPNMRRYRN